MEKENKIQENAAGNVTEKIKDKIAGKPRIICTLGTTTDDPKTLSRMVEYGMNCARINTAYADIPDYKKRVGMLKEIADIPVIMDLKGPQIRLKAKSNMKVRQGDILMIGFNEGNVHFNKDFYNDISNDDKILFENGTIETIVLGKDEKRRRVNLLVNNPGDGNFHKDMGVNVPGKDLEVELFSEKDIKVIEYVVENGLEYIAQSYVRNKNDLRQLYKEISRARYRLAKTESKQVNIIAKIECEEGIKNLDEIIGYAKAKNIDFSVMVARGDLYVELPPHKLPYYQKQIIKKCKEHGVPVIVATGFLESMTRSKSPSRAEISDVANAVLDGCDAIMLSGETSNSRYPDDAVKELRIIMDEYSGK